MAVGAVHKYIGLSPDCCSPNHCSRINGGTVQLNFVLLLNQIDLMDSFQGDSAERKEPSANVDIHLPEPSTPSKGTIPLCLLH